MKTIEVVAAVIRHGGKVFATQRGYGEYKDWWEFPGGKIENGESRREALSREIREELDTEINIGDFIATAESDYRDFHITMHCFWCSLRSGMPHIIEHEASAWVSAGDIYNLHWLPADMQIIPEVISGLEKPE